MSPIEAPDLADEARRPGALLHFDPATNTYVLREPDAPAAEEEEEEHAAEHALPPGDATAGMPVLEHEAAPEGDVPHGDAPDAAGPNSSVQYEEPAGVSPNDPTEGLRQRRV